MLLAINMEVFGVVVFVLTAIGLGYTIYLFIQSRRSMLEIMKQAEPESAPPLFADYPDDFPVPQPPPSKPAYSINTNPFRSTRSKPAAAPAADNISAGDLLPENKLNILKNTIANQKGILDALLQKVSELEASTGTGMQNENDALKEEIEKLQWQVGKKDSELQKLRQQYEVSQQMAKRLDEVYREFGLLQDKMATLEASASQAAELRMALDDEREAYLAQKRELTAKADKLERLVAENTELMQRLADTEDKLAEANLQRQQMFKKIAYLEDLNKEFGQVAEANKKLQSEMRRIGELESMLSMISEERDYLLRKRMQ